MAFVYVHNEGELLQKYLRNGLVPLTPQKINSNVNIDISIQSIFPSDIADCEETSNTYDKCLMSEIEEDLKNCTLPFLGYGNMESICRSFEDGLKALRIFNKEESKCKFPCYQINIDFQLNPSRPVISLMNPDINIIKNPSYYFYLPSEIKVSKMSEDYDIITFIAEFGGWSGLFIGISLLTITSKLLMFLNLESRSSIKQFTRGIIVCLSCIVLGYVSYSSVKKLLSHETSQDIILNTNYSGISLSVCNEESIFSYSSEFLGKTSSFWKNGSNMTTMIERIHFTYKDSSAFTLYSNESCNENCALSQVILNNIIDKNGEVKFCQTIQIDNVRNMKISALKEIFLYIHLNNQFQSEIGKTRLTVLPPTSFEIYKKKMQKYLHDTSTKIKLIYNEKVKKNTETFDHCFMSNLKKNNLANYSMLETVLQPIDIRRLEKGIQEDDLKEYRKLLNTVRSICSTIHDHVTATYQTQEKLQMRPIAKNLSSVYQEHRQ